MTDKNETVGEWLDREHPDRPRPQMLSVHIEVSCEECGLYGHLEEVRSLDPAEIAREKEALLVAGGCVHARKRVGANEHGIYVEYR